MPSFGKALGQFSFPDDSDKGGEEDKGRVGFGQSDWYRKQAAALVHSLAFKDELQMGIYNYLWAAVSMW